MSTKEDFRPNNKELDALRQAGLTRIQIAVRYDVPLSRVKRWLRELDIVPRANRNNQSKPKIRVREKHRYANFEEESLMDKAKAILGTRMTEKKHIGYLLDGRPVSSWQIAKEAGLKIERKLG